MANVLVSMLNVTLINQLAGDSTRTLQRPQLYLVINALLCHLQTLDPERSAFIFDLASKFTTNIPDDKQEKEYALLKSQSILDQIVVPEFTENSNNENSLAITMFIASVLTTLNEYHPSAMGVMGLTGVYSNELKRS